MRIYEEMTGIEDHYHDHVKKHMIIFLPNMCHPSILLVILIAGEVHLRRHYSHMRNMYLNYCRWQDKMLMEFLRELFYLLPLRYKHFFVVFIFV